MKKLISGVLLSAALCSSLSFADSHGGDNQAKLAEVQAAIDELNTQLVDVKSQRSDLEVELEDSETQISDALNQVAVIKKQIKAEEAKQEALSTEKK